MLSYPSSFVSPSVTFGQIDVLMSFSIDMDTLYASRLEAANGLSGFPLLPTASLRANSLARCSQVQKQPP